MKRLPERPDLDHLRRQAKDLLVLYKDNDLTAIARFRDSLPAAAGKSDRVIAGLGLRLHDAQSCLAREYGFSSWTDLKSFIEARNAQPGDSSLSILNWLRLVYSGEIAGGMNRAEPSLAARLLAESPDLRGDDPYVGCAIGDLQRLRQATAENRGWVNVSSGPLNLPPLVAVTHSGHHGRRRAPSSFLRRFPRPNASSSRFSKRA